MPGRCKTGMEKAIEDDKEEKDEIAIARKAEVFRLREVNCHYMTTCTII
jgi:hypothetical protein